MEDGDQIDAFLEQVSPLSFPEECLCQYKSSVGRWLWLFTITIMTQIPTYLGYTLHLIFLFRSHLPLLYNCFF